MTMKDDLRSWLWVVGIALGILVWTGLSYLLFPDIPRNWDYGSVPYIPASSYYTTKEPPVGGPAAERQIPPIPQPQELPR